LKLLSFALQNKQLKQVCHNSLSSFDAEEWKEFFLNAVIPALSWATPIAGEQIIYLKIC
jgi:hypothetical protein